MKKMVMVVLAALSAPVFADGLAGDLLAGKKYVSVNVGLASNVPTSMVTPGMTDGSFWRLAGGSVAASGVGVELAYTDFTYIRNTMSFSSKSHSTVVSAAGTYRVNDVLGLDWTPKLGLAMNKNSLNIGYSGTTSVSKSESKVGVVYGVDLHLGNWLLNFDQNTAGTGGYGVAYRKQF